LCYLEAIREKDNWVPHNHPIFLYPDNTSAQGTQEVVDKYAKMLADNLNVLFVHQCPRSSATNVLNLEMWIVFKNVVEKCPCS
jgi:hypothetical protein